MRALAAFVILTAATSAFADHDCDRPIADVKEMIVHGSFAYDRGCIYEGYTLDGKHHKLTEAAPVLALRGWKKAGAAEREKLATWWMREVLLDPGSLMDDDQVKEEKRVKLEPPKTTARKDGSVVFVGWYREPSGMVPIARWGKLEAVFGADGNVTSSKMTETREAKIGR